MMIICAPVAQVGYQITTVKFFLFFALTFELLLISETLGILCAGLHRNELVGMIILATFYVPLLMFTGFIQVRCCLRRTKPSAWSCCLPGKHGQMLCGVGGRYKCMHDSK